MKTEILAKWTVLILAALLSTGCANTSRIDNIATESMVSATQLDTMISVEVRAIDGVPEQDDAWVAMAQTDFD
ncbi:MAG: hypothetical protein AAF351_02265 [Pseudomonadota bacterium]